MHWSSGVRGSAGVGGDDLSNTLLARVELQSENWLRKTGRCAFESSFTSSTSSSGVTHRDGSRRKPRVRNVSGAALFNRVCVKLKMPSAYALSTGFAVFRGDIGDAGMTGDLGSVTEAGKVDARGVGSTSSGSSSSDVDDDDGSEFNVLTEALRCTCRSGDKPNPSLDGVLKLNVLAGSDS